LIFGALLLVIALVANKSNSAGLDGDETALASVSDFSELAVMGGVRKNLSDDFRGGAATAVMGGIDIDLRDATMVRREAVLDVSTVMGGVKIRVPETWTVVTRVNNIMGGYSDSTRRPKDDDHRLILKGTLLMGGLKVTN
jgi:hypothetical protein